jgi:hypothetical protein
MATEHTSDLLSKMFTKEGDQSKDGEPVFLRVSVVGVASPSKVIVADEDGQRTVLDKQVLLDEWEEVEA